MNIELLIFSSICSYLSIIVCFIVSKNTVKYAIFKFTLWFLWKYNVSCSSLLICYNTINNCMASYFYHLMPFKPKLQNSISVQNLVIIGILFSCLQIEILKKKYLGMSWHSFQDLFLGNTPINFAYMPINCILI